MFVYLRSAVTLSCITDGRLKVIHFTFTYFLLLQFRRLMNCHPTMFYTPPPSPLRTY